MFRKIRRSEAARVVAGLTAGVLAWWAGPSQAVAGTTHQRADLRRKAEARRLDPHELRAIRGRQITPGGGFSSSNTISGGPAQPWGFSFPDLGGYGQISTGNQLITLPLFSHGGRGLSFALYYNTQRVAGPPSAALPPIARGWTHTFTTRVENASGGKTVVQGNGTAMLFTQNIDGSFTAPAGIYQVFAQNGAGGWTLTHKNGLVESFDSSGRLSTQTDRNGNTTSVSYYTSGNGAGQVHQITDDGGRSVTLAYNGSGLLSSVTDGAGRTWDLAYHSTDYTLTTVTCPAPATGVTRPYWGFTTNSNGMVTGFRNRRGAEYAIAYHSSNTQWPVTITDPYSHTLSVDYTNKVITREDGTDLSWTVDSAGNRTSMTLEADLYHGAQTEYWTWDSAHNMQSHSIGGSTYASHYTHDSRGNVLTVEDAVTYADPNVVKETYTYNSLDLPDTRTDALGNTTTFQYDTAGNLTEVEDPLMLTTGFTYDSQGQRTHRTDARSKVWVTSYDTYGNVTGTTDPLSHASSITYGTTDAILGRPTSTTSATGLTESFTYDGMGRRTKVTHGDLSDVETTYDGEGAVLTVTDENNKTTTTVYNLLGLPTSVTDPESQTTSFTYTYTGVRTGLTNARNKTTTFTVDNAGRAVRTDYPDSTYETAVYNTRGLLSSTTDGRGYTVSYSYDNAGRKTGIDYPTGTDTSFTYRNDDRLSGMTDRTGSHTWTYNARGELTSLAAPNGTLSYTYYATGERYTLGRSGLSGTWTYTLNDAGQLTSQTNPFSETTGYTLDDDGRITQQTHANGTKVIPSYHTSRGWLAGVTHKKSDNTVLAAYSYSRDSAGVVTGEGQSGVYSVTYTYDDTYQLTREQRTGTAAYDYTYTYDAAGNRLSKYDGTTTESYSYDDADKLLSAGSKSYGYDNAGNLTSVTVGSQVTTLSWDYAGRLTGITYPNTSTNSFTYNDLGQRTTKVDSGGTLTSLYDGSRVVADSRADYTNGGLTGLVSERASGTTLTYHGDQLGSTRGLTNGSQTVTASRERDAWGNVVASSGTLAGPFGFVGGQGYQQDADSGLMLLGSRYFDPSVGRFISRDSIRFRGGINLYAYCGNSPAGSTDPSGLIPPKWFGFSVVGAVAVVAITLVKADVDLILDTWELNQQRRITDQRTAEMEQEYHRKRQAQEERRRSVSVPIHHGDALGTAESLQRSGIPLDYEGPFYFSSSDKIAANYGRAKVEFTGEDAGVWSIPNANDLLPLLRPTPSGGHTDYVLDDWNIPEFNRRLGGRPTSVTNVGRDDWY